MLALYRDLIAPPRRTRSGGLPVDHMEVESTRTQLIVLQPRRSGHRVNLGPGRPGCGARHRRRRSHLGEPAASAHAATALDGHRSLKLRSVMGPPLRFSPFHRWTWAFIVAVAVLWGNVGGVPTRRRPARRGRRHFGSGSHHPGQCLTDVASKVAMATAMASSKLLPAAVNASVTVRGYLQLQCGTDQEAAGPHDGEVGWQWQRDSRHIPGPVICRLCSAKRITMVNSSPWSAQGPSRAGRRYSALTLAPGPFASGGVRYPATRGMPRTEIRHRLAIRHIETSREVRSYPANPATPKGRTSPGSAKHQHP